MPLINACNYNTHSKSDLTTDTTNINTAVGVTILTSTNPSGALYNTAMGYQALNALTTAASCTAVGYQALSTNTSGTENTAIGSNALSANTTGAENTAIGSRALSLNTIGGSNTAVGNQALRVNTTGTRNVAVGSRALSSNTTGDDNVAIGEGALGAMLRGDDSVAIGRGALQTTTFSSANVAVGTQSMQFATTTGGENIAIGNSALFAIAGGEFNVGLGSLCLGSLTSASRNVAIGVAAFPQLTTGSSCTAIGYDAGRGHTTGDNTISIGAGVRGEATESGTTRLGATASMTRCFIAGIYGTISTRGDQAPMLIDSHGQLASLGTVTNGQLVIGNSNTGIPEVATLSPGSGISITNGEGGITIAASGGLTWTEIGASLTATTNTGYIGTTSSLTVGLPVVSAVGDQLGLLLFGGTDITLSQAAGQRVSFGSLSTTAGTGGTIVTTDTADSVTILCTIANTEWAAISSQGNWTVN